MNIFRSVGNSNAPSAVSVGVLYMCLLSLVNTIFFPTVQASLARRAEVHIQVHSDSSVMEVVMEKFFGVGDTDTGQQDDEDHLIESEPYIVPALYPISRVAAFAECKKTPRIPSAPSNPTLEKTTPPPKYS